MCPDFVAEPDRKCISKKKLNEVEEQHSCN